MFGVVLIAYALMAADRYLFPVLASDVRRNFDLSLARMGLLSTIFALGLAAGGLPTGYLLARWPRKAVMLIGIAVFSAATLLIAVSAGFWPLMVCLTLSGVGMAMLATVTFTLACSCFRRHRAAAVGSVNLSYGVGAVAGPILTGILLASSGRWRVPMISFGLFGFIIIGAIFLVVHHSVTETPAADRDGRDGAGASSLLNRNSVLLTVLSATHGLILYGFLGLYPTFLRDGLKYPPRAAGWAMSCFGFGALLSLAGGWLGDRFSPRVILSAAFVCTSALGYAVFHGPTDPAVQSILSLAFGAVASGILYVNLAACHVKALWPRLASRGSGLFVTSLYGSGAVAGYSMGWLANQGGWVLAGTLQISALSVVAAAAALMLRPRDMSA
jgi:predicted MFS family arabinose efflux permease